MSFKFLWYFLCLEGCSKYLSGHLAEIREVFFVDHFGTPYELFFVSFSASFLSPWWIPLSGELVLQFLSLGW